MDAENPTTDDEVYLAMLVDAARREQAIGYPGWVKPPAEIKGALRRLTARQLVVWQDANWLMPTEAGFAMVERHGHA
jgi:hypothetical protein